MKKLILNIGQEAVVGAVYETVGKSKNIRRVIELSCLEYYNNAGRLDIGRIAVAISKLLPRDCRHLDIDLILPTYVTENVYVDAINEKAEKDQEKENKIKTEKVVFVGESQTKKINQVITYNNKELASIVSAFHRQKLNVVRALSNMTCYHNYVSLFNHSEMYGNMEFKTHVCIVWGVSKIQYFVMLGNLPVEVRTANYSLTEFYGDLVAMGCDLPLSYVLKALNNLRISTNPDDGLIIEHDSSTITDGPRTIELDETVMLSIKNAFYSFVTGMAADVRSVYDYVREKYSSANVHVCTNSKLLDECLCKTFGDTFPVEYLNETSQVEVYNTRFHLKSIPEITDKYAPIIGCAIEGIKKGGDFYDA